MKPTRLQNHDRLEAGGHGRFCRKSPSSGPTQGDDPGATTTPISEAYAGIDHHTVLLDRQYRAHGKNLAAFKRLRLYFPERFKWPGLPRTLQWWIEQQTKLRGWGAEKSLADSLVLKRKARRLVIRVEPVLGDHWLLLLAEERTVLAPDRFQRFGLTGRESQLLPWMVRGKSNSEIARLLAMSTRTVEKHIENVLAKLQVSSRMKAMLRIMEFSRTGR